MVSLRENILKKWIQYITMTKRHPYILMNITFMNIPNYIVIVMVYMIPGIGMTTFGMIVTMVPTGDIDIIHIGIIMDIRT